MKTIDNRGIRSAVMTAALSIGLGCVTHASADEAYLIDLNAKTATDLGNVTPTALNDAGQVVGYSTTTSGSYDYFHAFITGPNGVGMRDLGSLGGDSSRAYGINNAGQVVGDSYTSDGLSDAFITGPNGVGMRDLGMQSGFDGSEGSSANGINAAGQVVGTIFYHQQGFNGGAFITGPNGLGMTPVAGAGGASYANAINDAGQVVGETQTGYQWLSGFISGPNGVGTTLLLDTQGRYIGSATDINNAGQVVGYSETADGQHHAFITGPNGVGMIDLNSLVHLPGGLVLSEAIAINNAGQIIATTIIPEPESYALLLAGLVLTGVMARRKQKADALEGVLGL